MKSTGKFFRAKERIKTKPSEGAQPASYNTKSKQKKRAKRRRK